MVEGRGNMSICKSLNITFSPNVEGKEMNKIQRMFYIRDIQIHDKYLGLPSIMGKKITFNEIEEKVWENLSLKKKLFTMRGNEVLIKVVA